jgi:4-amino-4-deoxy-L-arabinose transferase-like glycosyltransferase
MVSASSRQVRRPAGPWLVAIVVVAAALRLPTVGRESLWFDEAVSYLAARLPVRRILDNTLADPHPPLYYLLLHGWLKVVPSTDAAARLLGTAWDLLLVPALYCLTVELYGDRRRGLFAALLVALSPFHIVYSHELRMYTQLMLLVTVGTAAYVHASRGGVWGWWVAFAGAYLAAVYTHLFAFLALGAIGLYALIHHRDRTALYRTVILSGVIVLLFLPWVHLMSSEGPSALGSMRPLHQMETPRPGKGLTTAVFLVFGQSYWLAYTGLAMFATLSLVVVVTLEVRKRWSQRQVPGPALPGLMVLCGVAIPVMIYWLRPFFLPERVMAGASPFLLLLFVWGLRMCDSPLPYIAYGAAGLMVVGSALYLTGDWIKPPYREAIELIAQERAEGDVVLHTSDGSYLPALRYADLPAHAVLAGDPDPRKPRAVYEALGGKVWSLEGAERAGKRLWLVVALEHSVEWQTAQAERVAEEHKLLDKHDVGGIEILLYDLTEGSGRP